MPSTRVVVLSVSSPTLLAFSACLPAWLQVPGARAQPPCFGKVGPNSARGGDPGSGDGRARPRLYMIPDAIFLRGQMASIDASSASLSKASNALFIVSAACSPPKRDWDAAQGRSRQPLWRWSREESERALATKLRIHPHGARGTLVCLWSRVHSLEASEIARHHLRVASEIAEDASRTRFSEGDCLAWRSPGRRDPLPRLPTVSLKHLRSRECDE